MAEAARKHRKEKSRNRKIAEIKNIQRKLTEVIEKIRLRWFGNLKKMGSDRIPKS